MAHSEPTGPRWRKPAAARRRAAGARRSSMPSPRTLPVSDAACRRRSRQAVSQRQSRRRTRGRGEVVHGRRARRHRGHRRARGRQVCDPRDAHARRRQFEQARVASSAADCRRRHRQPHRQRPSMLTIHMVLALPETSGSRSTAAAATSCLPWARPSGCSCSASTLARRLGRERILASAASNATSPASLAPTTASGALPRHRVVAVQVVAAARSRRSRSRGTRPSAPAKIDLFKPGQDDELVRRRPCLPSRYLPFPDPPRPPRPPSPLTPAPSPPPRRASGSSRSSAPPRRPRPHRRRDHRDRPGRPRRQVRASDGRRGARDQRPRGDDAEGGGDAPPRRRTARSPSSSPRRTSRGRSGAKPRLAGLAYRDGDPHDRIRRGSSASS